MVLPEYVINDDRRKQVNDIAKAAKGSDLVYLATDLDREGEAIAWHVAEAAHVPRRRPDGSRSARSPSPRSAKRSRTRGTSTRTSSTHSRPGGSSTGSSATR
jgi:hypothetical protein